MSGDVSNQRIDLSQEKGCYFAVYTDIGHEIGIYPTPLASATSDHAVINVAVTGVQGIGLHTSTHLSRFLERNKELDVWEIGKSTVRLGKIRAIIQGTLPS